MRRIRALLLLPVLAALLSFPMEAIATGRAASKPTSTAPARSDSQIEALIRAKLAKSKIGKDGFKFHVQHGVVTWEGTTNVIQHKGSATRMARTAGATQVINNIQISDSAKAKAAANLKKATVVQ